MSFWNRVRCRMGWHQWEPWRDIGILYVTEQVSETGGSVGRVEKAQERTCSACQRTEKRSKFPW